MIILVGIRNIPNPLVLFLKFEQPYTEQFDPTIFKTKNLQIQAIPAKMIGLRSILFEEEVVLVIHGSPRPHENSGCLR